MAARTSGAIGTATETAVIRYLAANGFPHAERRRLRGVRDAGDVTGIPGVVISVKGGNAAKLASDAQVAEWLDEAEKQKAHASADVFLLVLQRKGIGTANAGRWWAVMPGWQYEALCGSDRLAHERRTTGVVGLAGWRFGDRSPIRMHLSQVCPLLRYAGYGTPPDITVNLSEGATIHAGPVLYSAEWSQQ